MNDPLEIIKRRDAMLHARVVTLLRFLCTVALAVDSGFVIGYAITGEYYAAWSHFGYALWWSFARTLWLRKQ